MRSKKLKLYIAAMAAVVLGSLSLAPAYAYGGSETNPTACPNGKLVVNVTYTITNDPDSAVGGQNWATDTLNRHLQVWQTGSNEYCAALSDNGSFTTLGTVDPGTGTAGSLDAGVKGVISGGYTTGTYNSTFDGTAYATKGNLGSFDLSDAHPSILSYTPNWPFSQPYWGWHYHTAQNGNWTNAQSGNIGDITN